MVNSAMLFQQPPLGDALGFVDGTPSPWARLGSRPLAVISNCGNLQNLEIPGLSIGIDHPGMLRFGRLPFGAKVRSNRLMFEDFRIEYGPQHRQGEELKAPKSRVKQIERSFKIRSAEWVAAG